MALVFWIQKLKGPFLGWYWNCCFSVFISWHGDVWIITSQSASLKLQGYFMGSSTSSRRVRMPWIHAMIPTVPVVKPRIWFHCRIGLGSFGLPRWGAQKCCWKPRLINDISLDPSWALFFSAWPRTNQEFHEDTTVHENTIFMHLQQFHLFHFLMTSKAVKAMRSTDLVPPRLSLEDPLETVGISKMGVGLKTMPPMPADKVDPPVVHFVIYLIIAHLCLKMGKCWGLSVSFCSYPAIQLWSQHNVKCAYYATS